MPISNQSSQSIASKLTIKAVTGWQLDLPLSSTERAATQSCFIQITQTTQDLPQSKTAPNASVSPTTYQTLITAGQSATPLQMSQALCQLPPVDLLISGYRLPLNADALAVLQPKTIHLLTGDMDNMTISESSRLAILSTHLDNTANQTPQVFESSQVGTLQYELHANLTKNQNH